MYRTFPLGSTAIATGITGSGIDASNEPSAALTGTDVRTATGSGVAGATAGSTVAGGTVLGSTTVPFVLLVGTGGGPLPGLGWSMPSGAVSFPGVSNPSGGTSVPGLSEPGSLESKPLCVKTAELPPAIPAC